MERQEDARTHGYGLETSARSEGMFSPVRSQETRDIEALLVQCWASVVDGGPTLNQQWLNVSCLLG